MAGTDSTAPATGPRRGGLTHEHVRGITSAAGVRAGCRPCNNSRIENCLFRCPSRKSPVVHEAPIAGARRRGRESASRHRAERPTGGPLSDHALGSREVHSGARIGPSTHDVRGVVSRMTPWGSPADMRETTGPHMPSPASGDGAERVRPRQNARWSVSGRRPRVDPQARGGCTAVTGRGAFRVAALRTAGARTHASTSEMGEAGGPQYMAKRLPTLRRSMLPSTGDGHQCGSSGHPTDATRRRHRLARVPAHRMP